MDMSVLLRRLSRWCRLGCPQQLPGAGAALLGARGSALPVPAAGAPGPPVPAACQAAGQRRSTQHRSPCSPSALSHSDCFSGLRLAEQLGRREDEAKIRHGLGLSLWASGNLEESQHQVHHGLP